MREFCTKVDAREGEKEKTRKFIERDAFLTLKCMTQWWKWLENTYV